MLPETVDASRVLRWAAQQPARYIGMIGSRRKVVAIYRELEKEGIPREKLTRVHAPVGLDIGAITPEEIAVAIVAELIAIRHGAGGPSGNVVEPEQGETDVLGRAVVLTGA